MCQFFKSCFPYCCFKGHGFDDAILSEEERNLIRGFENINRETNRQNRRTSPKREDPSGMVSLINQQLNDAQREVLEEAFLNKPFPKRHEYRQLAVQLGIAFPEVVEWFLDRRRVWRVNNRNFAASVAPIQFQEHTCSLCKIVLPNYLEYSFHLDLHHIANMGLRFYERVPMVGAQQNA